MISFFFATTETMNTTQMSSWIKNATKSRNSKISIEHMTKLIIRYGNERRYSLWMNVYNSFTRRFFFATASLVSSAVSLAFFVAFFLLSFARSLTDSTASAPNRKSMMIINGSDLIYLHVDLLSMLHSLKIIIINKEQARISPTFVTTQFDCLFSYWKEK